MENIELKPNILFSLEEDQKLRKSNLISLPIQLRTVTPNGNGFNDPNSRFRRTSITACMGESHIALHITQPNVGQNRVVTHAGAFDIKTEVRLFHQIIIAAKGKVVTTLNVIPYNCISHHCEKVFLFLKSAPLFSVKTFCYVATR